MFKIRRQNSNTLPKNSLLVVSKPRLTLKTFYEVS